MEDIYYNIFTFLHTKDILSCSSVNNIFRNISFGNMIWKKLMILDFKDVSLYKINYHETYKLCYKLKEVTKLLKYKITSDIDELYNMHDLSITSWGSLRKIPPVIFELNNLRTLAIHSDKIPIIPRTIEHLSNLEILDLNSNYITYISPHIGKLHNLKSLKLNNNKITNIPSEFGDLYNLKSLYLNNNQIVNIPTQFSKLYNLEELHLYQNKIINLPSELCKLNLKILNLTLNKIKIIPPEIEQLCSLEELFLSHNPIIRLPIELIRLNNIHTFALEDYTHIIIPFEVMLKFNIKENNTNYRILDKLKCGCNPGYQHYQTQANNIAIGFAATSNVSTTYKPPKIKPNKVVYKNIKNQCNTEHKKSKRKINKW
jgi:Leucine-rich repeat (LRR) protein